MNIFINLENIFQTFAEIYELKKIKYNVLTPFFLTVKDIIINHKLKNINLITQFCIYFINKSSSSDYI